MKLSIEPEQRESYSHHCSNCNKVRPLEEFIGIGEQISSRSNVFGYLVNCKICNSTVVINKSKDTDYEEKVNRVEKRNNTNKKEKCFSFKKTGDRHGQ